MVGGSFRLTKGRINLGDWAGICRRVQVVQDRPLAAPAGACPPLDSDDPPLEEAWAQAGGGRGAPPPEVCAWVVGTSMEVKMPCVVCGPERRGGEKPGQLGRARWLRLRSNSPGRPVWPGRAGAGGRGKKKNQGSVGRERPGSGADAWRTMGLLKEMLEEVWPALCIASSALQVGIGQLNFNEVHSKVCSSAWAFERGARLNGDRRWEGEGAAEMSSRWMVEEEMKACSVWRAGEGMGGKINTSPCILIGSSRCWEMYVAALFRRPGWGRPGRG